MHPQVTSCQDCWQDYWHRIQILRSVACKNHPWSSTATGICSFQSYLRRFWLESNIWEHLRISSPTSRSPEGVITWGGGVPKESSGHTWGFIRKHPKKLIVNLPGCQPHMSTSYWAYHWWWCSVGRVETRGDPPRHPQTCWCRRYSVAGFLWQIRCLNKISLN